MDESSDPEIDDLPLTEMSAEQLAEIYGYVSPELRRTFKQELPDYIP